MGEEEKLKRPLELTVLLGVTFVTGALVGGLATYCLLQGWFQFAVMLGSLAFLMAGGSVGTFLGKNWGVDHLTRGLVIAAVFSALAALFSFIVGEHGDGPLDWTQWAFSSLAVLQLFIAFRLHSTKVSSYFWGLALVEGDRVGPDETSDENIVLAFGNAEGESAAVEEEATYSREGQ